MLLARLLAALFVLASASALTQTQPAIGGTTPLGAWDIVPPAKTSIKVPFDFVAGEQTAPEVEDRVARLFAAIPWDPSSQTVSVHVSPEGRIAAWVMDDSVCYTIRGYQVARDSKSSDAVHPVRTSTCQPGRRFQLKTTELRSGSSRDQERVR